MDINLLLRFKKWHIDRYGNVYGVHSHICSDTDWYHSHHSAAWLWCNGFPVHESVCEKFLSEWFWVSYSEDHDEESFKTVVTDTLSAISCLEGNHKSLYLIDTIIDLTNGLRAAQAEGALSINKIQLTKIGSNLDKFVQSELIQADLTNEGELVFNIMSPGYDWSDIVYYFVNLVSCDLGVESVTVRAHPNIGRGEDFAFKQHILR